MQFTIPFKDLFDFKNREDIKNYILDAYGIKYYNFSLRKKVMILNYWIKIVGYA